MKRLVLVALLSICALQAGADTHSAPLAGQFVEGGFVGNSAPDFLDARSPRRCRTCGLEALANPGDTTGRADADPVPPPAPTPSRGGDDR